MMESFDFRTVYLILQTPSVPPKQCYNIAAKLDEWNSTLSWGGEGEEITNTARY